MPRRSPFPLTPERVDECERAIVDILLNGPGWGIKRQVLGQMLLARQFREVHWHHATRRLAEAGKITVETRKPAPNISPETIYRLAPRRSA